MAGQIIPRGETTWLIRVFVGRDPITHKRIYVNKTLHGYTRTKAEKYLNRLVAAHDEGKHPNAANTPMEALFDGLLLDYKSNGKSYPWASLVVRVHLRPFFGKMKAARVGTDHIQAYIAHRLEPTKRILPNGRTRNIPPAANATINRELSLLRRAFNLGKTATPPKVAAVPFIPMLKENNVRRGFFEDDTFLVVRRVL